MIGALEDYTSTVTITNLHFADDIDGLAGKEEELTKLISGLDQTSMKYGKKINAKNQGDDKQ